MNVFGTSSPARSRTLKECQHDVVRTSFTTELPRIYSMRRRLLHISSDTKNSARRNPSTVQSQLAPHSSHRENSSLPITTRDYHARAVLRDCVLNADRRLNHGTNVLPHRTLSSRRFGL